MLQQILAELKRTNTRLVAVSKTKSPEQILSIYHQGHKIFGENRVQEITSKYEVLPRDIEWHYIGHLQSNKVKFIVPFVHLIHSIDSLKLLKTVNKEAKKCQRVIDCLLQFHIAEEESKFGLDLSAADDLLSTDTFKHFENVRIVGVMGMATFTEDHQQVKEEFEKLHTIFEELQKTFFVMAPSFKEISMGMSGDYKIALEEGSTIVRIGSLIFGPRSKN